MRCARPASRKFELRCAPTRLSGARVSPKLGIVDVETTPYLDILSAWAPRLFLDVNCLIGDHLGFLRNRLLAGLMRSGAVHPSRSYSARH
jgi:hypothetical protein